jgi:hypothetical protein
MALKKSELRKANFRFCDIFLNFLHENLEFLVFLLESASFSDFIFILVDFLSLLRLRESRLLLVCAAVAFYFS